MPIIDRELVGKTPFENLKRSNVGISEFLMGRIQNNIIQYGDSSWTTDISTGKSKTYSELLSESAKIASALIKRGFKIGDNILLMAPNLVELPITMLGAWRAGGSCACLTLNLLKEDIRKRATDMQSKFILTDEVRAERVREAVKDLHFVQEVIVIGQAYGCTPVELLFNDDGKDCPERVEIDLDSLAWLMYSSGTTGIPKGIVHTHRNLTCYMENRSGHALKDMKVLFINYMINSGGMAMFLLLSLAHCHFTIISKYDDNDLLKVIEKVRPTCISIFPCQIAAICKHPNLDQYDLRSVGVVVTGGSLIYPKYEREIFDKLPNMIFLYTGYGMSESLIFTSNESKDQTVYTKEKCIKNYVFGSCGKVSDFVKLKIVDEFTGEKLGPHEIGEICCKSPFTMKEYLNNPKATAEAIKDGWFHTGDKGYYDTNENVFVVGRFKEMIKYRMAHVVPTNIEKQMMTHPAIEEVGVVGRPHDVDGEWPSAFVVLRKGHTATAEEVMDHTNKLVVDEERLRGGVRFIDRIPRNELGKIVRPKLSILLQ